MKLHKTNRIYSYKDWECACHGKENCRFARGWNWSGSRQRKYQGIGAGRTEIWAHVPLFDIIGGVAGLEAYGDALRPQDYELGRSCDSILFGSVGDPRKYTFTGANGTKKYPSRKEAAVKALASFRRGMELFANIRPAKVYPQLIQASPLKDTVARELDLIVLRENTAGIFYAGKYRKEIGGELTACDECVYTWSQIERHARCAFDLAMGRKKHVTMVNKPNAMETGVLWQTVYEKVAEEYPEVHYETMLIDGCAARLVSRPGYFDVIAAENMFGDILSDLANSVGHCRPEHCQSHCRDPLCGTDAPPLLPYDR